MKSLARSALAAVVLSTSATFVQADYHYGYSIDRQYAVTITNITKGIVFTPFLAATHNKRIAFFEVGETASEAVGRVAEGGDIADLNTLLDDSNLVFDTEITAGLLEPGQSVTLEIDAKRRFNRLSLISMLLPTNDSMAALNSVKLPARGSTTYYAQAYDAGTETNDELCANIPGPQCGGSPFSPEDEGEGYVFPATGIHGESDLSREAYLWDGPVVKVTVTRQY